MDWKKVDGYILLRTTRTRRSSCSGTAWMVATGLFRFHRQEFMALADMFRNEGPVYFNGERFDTSTELVGRRTQHAVMDSFSSIKHAANRSTAHYSGRQKLEARKDRNQGTLTPWSGSPARCHGRRAPFCGSGLGFSLTLVPPDACGGGGRGRG